MEREREKEKEGDQNTNGLKGVNRRLNAKSEAERAM